MSAHALLLVDNLGMLYPEAYMYMSAALRSVITCTWSVAWGKEEEGSLLADAQMPDTPQ